MPDLKTFEERNARYAAGFDAGGLAMRPRSSVVVVTCVDARVDPAHFLGLEPGDALVIHNGGGRVTPDVVQNLGVLQFMFARMAEASGSSAPPLEVAIVHHTDCGAARLSNPQLQSALGAHLNVAPEQLARMAIADPHQSVREDLERLRAAPVLPDDLVVSGHVYDVGDGRLHEVFPPTALRGGRGAS